MSIDICNYLQFAEDSDLPLFPSCRPTQLAGVEFPEYRKLPAQVFPCVQQVPDLKNFGIAFEYSKLQLARAHHIAHLNLNTQTPGVDQFVRYSDTQLLEHPELRHVPYAFIRLANEELTLRACLDSLEGVITKGIIAYHERLPGTLCDNSLVIAREFVARNRGFKLVKYELPVLPNNSNWVASQLADPQRHQKLRGWLLDSFYNYTLDQVSAWAQEQGDYEHAFLIKIDGDHVYSPTLLQHLINESKILFYRYGMECLSAAKVNVCLDYRQVVRSTYDTQIFTPAQLQELHQRENESENTNAAPLAEQTQLTAAGRLRLALRVRHLLHLASRGLAPVLLEEVACDADHQIIYLPMHNRHKFMLSIPRSAAQRAWHEVVRQGEVLSWELLLPPRNMIKAYHYYQHLTSTHWGREKRMHGSLEHIERIARKMEENPKLRAFMLRKDFEECILDCYNLDRKFFSWENVAQQARSFNYEPYLPQYLAQALLALHELGWEQSPTWSELYDSLQRELQELMELSTWSKVTQPCGWGETCQRLRANPNLAQHLEVLQRGKNTASVYAEGKTQSEERSTALASDLVTASINSSYNAAAAV